MELSVSSKTTATAKWNLTAAGFIRDVPDLITLVGTDKLFAYYNVAKARSQGGESAADWTAPKDRFTVSGNITWIDLRNLSTTGLYKEYNGDKIPNRPYLFGRSAVCASEYAEK